MEGFERGGLDQLDTHTLETTAGEIHVAYLV